MVDSLCGPLTITPNSRNSGAGTEINGLLPLTATATALTRAEIIERLALNDAAILVSGFDRPSIRYTVQAKVTGSDQLGRFLQQHRGAAADGRSRPS